MEGGKTQKAINMPCECENLSGYESMRASISSFYILRKQLFTEPRQEVRLDVCKCVMEFVCVLV